MDDTLTRRMDLNECCPQQAGGYMPQVPSYPVPLIPLYCQTPKFGTWDPKEFCATIESQSDGAKPEFSASAEGNITASL